MMMEKKSMRKDGQGSSPISTESQFAPRPFTAPEASRDGTGAEAPDRGLHHMSFADIDIQPRPVVQPKLVLSPADSNLEGTDLVQRESTSDMDRTPEEERDTPNRTGMPDRLKWGIESLSGLDLSGVRVHYRSPKPAQINALAYTQGREIHVAPGQERHLPHEAWHLVQQAQGRVRPTMQLSIGVAVNDDRGLEKEADLTGTKASQIGHPYLATRGLSTPSTQVTTAGQRMMKANGLSEDACEAIEVSGERMRLKFMSIAGDGPLQMASAYNGNPINANTGAWGPTNLVINDKFNYANETPQQTARQAHADRIDGDWDGSSVESFPIEWAKFTQLIGPYSARNLVQGHMINQKIGGVGEAKNLAPLTSSANTRHWNSVEAPIKHWLDQDARNLIDYKITPAYAIVKPTLKNKLIDEFKQNYALGISDTPANLRAWVGNYIDQTIPSCINIQVNFAQINGPSPYVQGEKVRMKPLITGQISNEFNSRYNGQNVTRSRGKWTGWVYHPINTIKYEKATNSNTGTQGHAERIDNSHVGTPVNSCPTDWGKFTRLVGPDAVTEFVQGHLINQRIGGQGIARNLTPLTCGANAVHSQKVEGPIRSWLKSDPTAAGYTNLIDYKVSPQYGGADPGMKADLLKSFDDTNGEIRGDTKGNLITWLENYINLTFPEKLDIAVKFMKATAPLNGPRNGPGPILAKEKSLLHGEVTNEPA